MTSTKSPKETQPTTTTSTPSETFGQQLRRLRKKAGLTQEELAEKLDIHNVTVSKWENNELIPKTVNIRKLAEALHVPVLELLEPHAPNPTEWMLTIRIVDEFKEEVIDLNSDFPPIAKIILSHKGANVVLGGDYDIWADDKKFKRFIDELCANRQVAINHGISLGKIKPKK